MLSFWLFLLVIALYFVFRGSSASTSGFSSRMGAGFTYDQIDVRILALAAAVIRSDGKISDEEVRFVRKQFIGQFGQARAEKAFANYKTFTNKNSLEHICRELMFTTSYQSRQSILVFLFQVAASDGRISDEEVQLMARIAGWLGIAQQHFHYIYSAFAQGAYQRSGSQERGPKGASAGRSPYEVLGVSPTASEAEIKQSYRILVKKYHPDRLVKYPPEEQQIAKEKFIEIQDAYERIKKERGF